MKKYYLLFSFLFFLVISVVNAKDNDKLIGTWDVTVQDTPQGNVNVHLTIEKVDGTIKAKFKQAGSDQETSATVSEQENGITLYFFAEGYDLYMTIRPDGDDAVSGYLVDQFPVKGLRMNE